MKNKIGWCNMTWNPVWGCLNYCEYCYARAFAKRFGAIRFREEWEYRVKYDMDSAYFKLIKSLDLINFKPTFLYSQFNKKFPQKTQKIFIGSMSEIHYWREEWIEMVIEKIKKYPQHTFQFLTSFPQVYADWVFPKNCWLGITITNNKAIYNMDFTNMNTKRIKFFSIEPILEDIDIQYMVDSLHIDWLILGAETGNRKRKIIPKIEWIENVVNYCKWNNIPIYLKDSLENIYPENIKIFP